jgi:hypothetical protein
MKYCSRPLMKIILITISSMNYSKSAGRVKT